MSRQHPIIAITGPFGAGTSYQENTGKVGQKPPEQKSLYPRQNE
jgi:phosphoribulokinase